MTFDDVDFWLQALLTDLMDVWIAYQAAVILGCYVAARIAARWAMPRIEERLRGITGQPHLLRLLVVVARRGILIVLAILLWIAVGIFRASTWLGHSHLLLIAAQLVTAWAAASILSRTIRNRPVSRIVEVILWLAAGLAIVGWLDDAKEALEWVGVPVGGRRLSLLSVLQAAAVLAFFLWATSFATAALEFRLKSSDLLQPGFQVLVVKFFKVATIAAGVALALTAIGFDLTALTIFSGAFGLGLALSLQKVTSNLMSGFIILVDRSIKPGDVIELGTTFGWINSLKARYVSVVTRDGAEYLIPNETFVTERVINWSYTDRRVRQEIVFGVTYNCDPHEVRKLMVAAVAKVDRVLSDPMPVCHLVGFGNSSLNFTLRFWIDDPEAGLTNVKGLALPAVWDALKAHDIAIPYPHREVFLHPRD